MRAEKFESTNKTEHAFTGRFRADDAKKLVENFKVDSFKEVAALYANIRKAASMGKRSVCWPIPDRLREHGTEIVELLTEDGYVARRDNGSDQRDGESWDNLNVTW